MYLLKRNAFDQHVFCLDLVVSRPVKSFFARFVGNRRESKGTKRNLKEKLGACRRRIDPRQKTGCMLLSCVRACKSRSARRPSVRRVCAQSPLFGAWDLELLWNLELGPWNFTAFPHATAQNHHGFALMCTCVQLGAPSCGKMKKFRMVHKPHITAHRALPWHRLPIGLTPFQPLF